MGGQFRVALEPFTLISKEQLGLKRHFSRVTSNAWLSGRQAFRCVKADQKTLLRRVYRISKYTGESFPGEVCIRRRTGPASSDILGTQREACIDS